MKFTITRYDLSKPGSGISSSSAEVATATGVREACVIALALARYHAGAELGFGISLRGKSRPADLGTAYSAMQNPELPVFIIRAEEKLVKYKSAVAKDKRSWKFALPYFRKFTAKVDIEDLRHTMWSDAVVKAAIEREDWPAATARLAVFGFRLDAPGSEREKAEVAA